MPQDERQPVFQQELEFAVPDLGIERVHAGGVDADQYIIVLQGRIGDVCDPHVVLFSITVEEKSFHGE
ncbi:MAG TPA: hypothetical protein VFA75_14205 [Nevskia sp.]|nr:hypothetical protein [Nevskia sp.]